MLGFNDYCNPQGFEGVLNTIPDLDRKSFLDLESPGICLYHAGNFT